MDRMAKIAQQIIETRNNSHEVRVELALLGLRMRDEFLALKIFVEKPIRFDCFWT